MSVVTPLLIVGAIFALLWVGYRIGLKRAAEALTPVVLELAGYVSREKCFCQEWRKKTESTGLCLACRARNLVERMGVSEP